MLAADKPYLKSALLLLRVADSVMVIRARDFAIVGKRSDLSEIIYGVSWQHVVKLKTELTFR